MKKWRSLLALVLAAVLTLGTAVTAMAVDPAVPTTTLRFNLGGANSGIMTAGLGDDTITLDGYRLLKVVETPLSDGIGSAYVYSLREGTGAEPHPLTTIMVEALNGVFELDDERAAGYVTTDNLIERLADMNGDQPAEFAEAVWKGIQKYNEKNADSPISKDATFTAPTLSSGNNVEQGYWLFVEDRSGYTDEQPSAFLPILLDTLGKETLTVNLKKDAPSIDKDVEDKNGNYGDSNTASIGDTVDFKVTSKVPNMTGYDKYFFVVTDTLSKGLSFDTASVEITIGDETLTACTLPTDENHVAAHGTTDSTCDADYMVTSVPGDNDTTVVQIIFMNFIQWADNVKDEITITYSATLNEDAVIGNSGNPNSVKLTYSNDPTKEQDGDPENPDIPAPDFPIGETPESVTKTYVTGIQLNKVNGKNEKLPDAEFTITGESVNKVLVTGTVFVADENGTYYKLKDGTYTQTDPDGQNDEAYADTTTKYTKKDATDEAPDIQSVNVTAITGDNGVIKFSGLGEGVFKIEETQAPAGYNPLKEPIYVKISWDDTNNKWKAVQCSDEDGTPMTDDGIVTATNDGTITLTVENRTGTELPETGGIGTTIFYAAGVLLVLGAGALLLRKKRGETK